jgi:hypothetical protein
MALLDPDALILRSFMEGAGDSVIVPSRLPY